MAAVFGRARVAGQVIWAARFKERWVEGRSGGSKGAKTTSAAYSLSFAVAVCEGPIDGLVMLNHKVHYNTRLRTRGP